MVASSRPPPSWEGLGLHEAECNGATNEVKAVMATVRTFPFTIRGHDEGPVRGDVRTQDLGDGRPAVVIFHGFKGFKDWGFFPHIAERLARSGFTAVTFNFSGSGVGADFQTFSEPERFRRSTPTGDLADAATVWEAVLAGGLVDGLAAPSAAGVLGHSRGGGAAIVHAREHPECRALVTWAAISTYRRWGPETLRRWREQGSIDIVNARTGEVLPIDTRFLDDLEAHAERLDVLAAAAKVAVPWLLIHGRADETVKAEEAGQLRAAAGDGADLEIIDGGSHTLGAVHPWAGSTAQLDRAMDRTVGWFLEHLY
jgi:dienelactone hydrolase